MWLRISRNSSASIFLEGNNCSYLSLFCGLGILILHSSWGTILIYSYIRTAWLKPVLNDSIALLQQDTQLNRIADIKNNMNLWRTQSWKYHLKDSKIEAPEFQIDLNLMGISVSFKRLYFSKSRDLSRNYRAQPKGSTVSVIFRRHKSLF